MATEAILLQDLNMHSTQISTPTICSLSNLNHTLYDDFIHQSVDSSSNLERCSLGMNDDPDEFFKASSISRWNLIQEREQIGCNICCLSRQSSDGFDRPFITTVTEFDLSCAIEGNQNMDVLNQSDMAGDLTHPDRRNIHNMKECAVDGCNRKFKRLEHLRRHETVHEKIEKLSCRFCGNKFNRRDNLRVHIKRHAQPRKTSSRTKYYEEAGQRYAEMCHSSRAKAVDVKEAVNKIMY
ncbi:uncharacterized protein RAG0_02982 [Rhynchosporium agropyri]|uniref:C2H2-type domain-containing protein n=1 Tax=Rhynchosporium agropyri TaxID=914238 RepID=A0A1E1K2V1_9HELO|nr:uncharacterized protein RAG0_02982 [Rhynchosporium agropyri]